ncbi:MAG TPA: response regulator transcription factor [Chryseosolibacter sp.]|nr:response regulator transcription factor [Chryseosolibacter sp.]
MTSLLIIDDHPLINDGIKAMLKDVPGYAVTGACKTAKEALSFLLGEQMPDVILLDISLPDMDGLQLCAQIRKLNSSVKILGLTSANDAGIISGFLQRGGNGYLLKNMERDELVEAIATVLNGKIFVSKAANEKILTQLRHASEPQGNRPLLTRREKEILNMLSEGMKGPEIADKLFLSYYTVETHRKNLLKKFNANSVQMLLRIARDYGMLV